MSQEARIYREENGLPGLFEILQKVNSAYRGSYDFSSDEELTSYKEALNLTRKHWEDASNRFEGLLRDLVSEACWQCEVLQKLARRLREAEVRASRHRVEGVAMRDAVDALIAIEVETLASFQDNFAMSMGMLPSAKRDEIDFERKASTYDNHRSP